MRNNFEIINIGTFSKSFELYGGQKLSRRSYTTQHHVHVWWIMVFLFYFISEMLRYIRETMKTLVFYCYENAYETVRIKSNRLNVCRCSKFSSRTRKSILRKSRKRLFVPVLHNRRYHNAIRNDSFLLLLFIYLNSSGVH